MLTDTVAILTLLLSLILLVPWVCRKCYIPTIVGLIVAGIIIGPHGLGWINRSASIDVLGKIGLLYIMFLSGIEVDMNDFRRDGRRGVLFGALTFAIPLCLGCVCFVEIFHYSLASALLVASMLASHTLLTYPTISRYGIQRNSAVNMAIIGTVLAMLLSLLLLTLVTSSVQGNMNASLGLRMSIGTVLFCIVVLLLYPRFARWFFKRYSDPIIEFLFILILVSISALMAELVGLQDILGAFLAGVALNKCVPNSSPLMNRIGFVGNALFIPLFLLSVGMLVNVYILASGWSVLYVALTMILCKLCGKWLAAREAQYLWSLGKNERRLLFGMTAASAAAALAVVTIGYQIILPDGSHLMGDEIFNAAILLILITSSVSAFLTEHAARSIAMEDHSAEYDNRKAGRILVPMGAKYSNAAVINLALLTMNKKAGTTLHAANVIQSRDEEFASGQLMEEAVRLAASAGETMVTHTAIAANIANGITQVVNDEHITSLVTELTTTRDGQSYNPILAQLLSSVSCQVSMYHCVQPINTIQRIIVAVPKHAELEKGFLLWFEQIRRLSSQLGAKVVFFSTKDTSIVLQQLASRPRKRMNVKIVSLEHWEDLNKIQKRLRENDLLVTILARRSTRSYNPSFESLPRLTYSDYWNYSCLIIFPQQSDTEEQNDILQQSMVQTHETGFELFKRIRLNFFRIHHKQ